MDDYDIFRGSQLSLVPADVILECIKYLYLNPEHTECIMNSLVGWDLKTINFHKLSGREEPLKVMFNELRLRDECKIICTAPDDHAARHLCAPIGYIHSVIQEGNRAAANVLMSIHLQGLVVGQAKTRIALERQPLAPQLSLPLITLPGRLGNKTELTKNNNIGIFTKMKTCLNGLCTEKIVDTIPVDVLLVDCLSNEDHVSNYHSALMYNLMVNLKQNFNVFVSPSVSENNFDKWKTIADHQLRHNADCFVLVVTPYFIANHDFASHTFCPSPSWHGKPEIFCQFSSKDGVNACTPVPESSSSSADAPRSSCQAYTEAQQRTAYLWQSLKASGKPIFVVLLDPGQLESARALSPLTVTLPEQLTLLMHLIGRTQKLSFVAQC